MKKISSLLTKLSISFICCLITVSLIVPKTLKAEVSNNDICDLILKKQYVLLSDEVIMDVLSGDVWGIFQDIFNGTMSYKTWKDTSDACNIDPNGSHGGHGGSIPNKVWYTVLNDTENDMKNGSNYNYYTTDSYNTTSNYSVYNTDYNNINYTYNNQTFNYNYTTAYYNTTNNSYHFSLTNNTELTVINNYNNTTVIDNGSSKVLYYRLPDGSNSLNMTEDIALNGFKTSLSVKSYENSYDSNDLVALYHFDGNELDSAYPTNAVLSFDRNSIQYIPSTTPFNESLALSESSEISVNKNSKFVSFRFYPLINDHFSLSINGTDIVERNSLIDTSYDYVEWNQTSYIENCFTVTWTDTSSSSSMTNITGYNQSTTHKNLGNGQYLHVSIFTSNYDSTALESNVTQRTYNIINNKIWEDVYSNLVNYNMWNYLTVNIDGSVYINGNDTGIDVDNTQNLTISIGGDSVTYIDELALFNSNHNNYSPFYPYSSNIVYSVPDYYEYIEVPGIKINQIVKISNNGTQTSSGITVFNNNNGSYILNGTGTNININYWINGDYNTGISIYDLINNHKYYIYDCNIYKPNGGSISINTINNNSSLFTSNNLSLGGVRIPSLNYYNQELNNYVVYPMLIDLTIMFGSGYEPSKEWCDQNLTNYIAYNVNPDVTESPYNIDTGYLYLKQVRTCLAKNNEILIQSIIPVSNWKIGGYRSSNPLNGDVFCNVDDLGYITSVQQYNGLDWVEVTAGLYNEYMGMWISALGFNIFNQNWDYTEYKYLNDGGSNSWLVRFLSDRFRNTDNILTDILEKVGLINPNLTINNEYNNDYNNVINNYNINPYDELNNRFNDIQEFDNQIDLTAPEFNIDSNSLTQAQELKQIPEAIVDGFIDLKIGYLLFIPLIIAIVRLIL